jgi:hypothetical protein
MWPVCWWCRRADSDFWAARCVFLGKQQCPRRIRFAGPKGAFLTRGSPPRAVSSWAGKCPLPRCSARPPAASLAVAGCACSCALSMASWACVLSDPLTSASMPMRPRCLLGLAMRRACARSGPLAAASRAHARALSCPLVAACHGQPCPLSGCFVAAPQVCARAWPLVAAVPRACAHARSTRLAARVVRAPAGCQAVSRCHVGPVHAVRQGVLRRRLACAPARCPYCVAAPCVACA